MQPEPTPTGSGSKPCEAPAGLASAHGEIGDAPQAARTVALNSGARQLPGNCKNGFDPESETAAAIASRRGGKLHNDYVHALGSLYQDTPKAVFAALAASFADRLGADDLVAALLDEWEILNQNGLVPQRAPHRG